MSKMSPPSVSAPDPSINSNQRDAFRNSKATGSNLSAAQLLAQSFAAQQIALTATSSSDDEAAAQLMERIVAPSMPCSASTCNTSTCTTTSSTTTGPSSVDACTAASIVARRRASDQLATSSSSSLQNMNAAEKDCRRWSQNDMYEDDEIPLNDSERVEPGMYREPIDPTANCRSDTSSVSDLSSAAESTTSRSTVTASNRSQTSTSRGSSSRRSSGNLSGSKRPSEGRLDVAEQFGKLSSGASGLQQQRSRSRKKLSRNSLEQYSVGSGSRNSLNYLVRSNVSMGNGSRSNLPVGRETYGKSSGQKNADWNIPPVSGLPLSSARSLASMQGLQSAQDVRNLLLARQNSVSGTAPAPVGSSAANLQMLQQIQRNVSIRDVLLQRAQMSTNSVLSHNSSAQEIALAAAQNAVMDVATLPAHRSSHSLYANTSQSPSMSSLSGAVDAAERPVNPFLGQCATTNFLDLLNSRAPGVPKAHTTLSPAVPTEGVSTIKSSALSQVNTTQDKGSSSDTNDKAAPSFNESYQMSAAAQNFINLIQQPATIKAPDLNINSIARKVESNAPGRKTSSPPSATTQSSTKKSPAIIGGFSQGSTCNLKKTGNVQEAIKVDDNGTLLTSSTTTSTSLPSARNCPADESNEEKSPQDVLEGLFEAHVGKCTIQPSLSVEGRFHKHTEEEIAAYPPTAMLVRNGDLNGLRMSHRSGTRLQTANKFGESLLHIACRRGFVEIATYLVEEANVDIWVRDDFGRTPLHDACWTARPNLGLVDLLIRKCPELLLLCDKRGNTPLHYVRRENWDLWKTFVKDRKDIICPAAKTAT